MPIMTHDIIIAPSSEHTDRPTVSVAMATYQGQAYLKEQLQSLLVQTLPPFELVVCDDQSTDDTVAIVQAFAQESPFPVHLHINPRRLGVTANFERAFSLCQGRYIAPCDQDDLWLPTRLGKLAGHLEKHPDCLLAFSNVALADERGQIIGQSLWQRLRFSPEDVMRFNQGRALEMLLRRNVATGMAMLFRRSLLEAALPMPAAHIHDEWLALLAAATGGVHAEEMELVRYRQHPGQQVGQGQDGLMGQYRHARQVMGRDYVDRQVGRTQQLVDRLATLPGVSPEVRQEVKAKLDHLKQRQHLRRRWWRRLPGAARLSLTGQYRRFGYGWKSMVQDLFL